MSIMAAARPTEDTYAFTPWSADPEETDPLIAVVRLMDTIVQTRLAHAATAAAPLDHLRTPESREYLSLRARLYDLAYSLNHRRFCGDAHCHRLCKLRLPLRRMLTDLT